MQRGKMSCAPSPADVVAREGPRALKALAGVSGEHWQNQKPVTADGKRGTVRTMAGGSLAISSDSDIPALAGYPHE